MEFEELLWSRIVSMGYPLVKWLTRLRAKGEAKVETAAFRIFNVRFGYLVVYSVPAYKVSRACCRVAYFCCCPLRPKYGRRRTFARQGAPRALRSAR